MNPITFNQNFEFVLGSKAYSKAIHRLDRSKPTDIATCLNGCEKSPLIVWDASGNLYDFHQATDAFHESGTPRLPFRQFRVNAAYAPDGTKEQQSRIHAWISTYHCNHKPDGYLVYLEIHNKKVKTRNPFLAEVHFIGDRVSVTPLMWDVSTKSFIDAPKFLDDGPKGDKKGFHWLFVYWVCMMAIDFQNPHLHFTKVSPSNPSGKSIHWVKAREHYVLIHKSHPANKAEAKTNRRMVIDGDTIDRAAHSRRAHYRMLRSPRFRHKIGQRVWVRSAWCGPKEWTDRSGQIYRIVDTNQTAQPL